jgi:phosphomevalonate kinase
MLVCISGKRFSGKDTLAAFLLEAAQRRGIALASHAFAAESKRMFAASRPGVDLARLLGDRAYKEQLRPELTKFTVDALAADPLVFCREVVRRIDERGTHALITDLRLRLELDHLRPRAPHVIRVQRPDVLRAAAGWSYDAAKDTHHTETELDDPELWSEVVDNAGTLDALAARADALVTKLLT